MWRQTWGPRLPGPCEGHQALPCGMQCAVCAMLDILGMLWAAGSAPSLLHFCLLVHSNSLLLSPPLAPKLCPSMYLEGAQGVCPMHFP